MIFIYDIILSLRSLKRKSQIFNLCELMSNKTQFWLHPFLLLKVNHIVILKLPHLLEHQALFCISRWSHFWGSMELIWWKINLNPLHFYFLICFRNCVSWLFLALFWVSPVKHWNAKECGYWFYLENICYAIETSDRCYSEEFLEWSLTMSAEWLTNCIESLFYSET